MVLGNLRQLADARRRQRSRSANVDVEAGVGRRRLDVERLARRGEHFGDGPSRLDRAAHSRREDGAAVDRHQAVRPEGGEAYLQHVVFAPPCVKYGAPASGPVGIDESVGLSDEAGSLQRRREQFVLPVAVARHSQMLQRAAAADSEMRADRRNAVGARAVDRNEMATVGMAVPLLDLGGLAR